MQIQTNIILKSVHERSFLMDVFSPSDTTSKHVVLFIHGFKGFKDWGHWNLLAEKFTEAGMYFIKFNYSHNGTTIEAPSDFEDLEAFGRNNFTMELDDLNTVIDWIYHNIPEISSKKLSLIGHSRGGGTAIVKAVEDSRIDKLITWASLTRFLRKFDEEFIENWKKTGVHHMLNGRTGQKMPLYYQLYENFLENWDRIDIPTVYKNLKKPHLIIHGTEDKAVPVSVAHDLKEWNPDSELKVIKGANHVFGGFHPFSGSDLPSDSQILLSESIQFIKKT